MVSDVHNSLNVMHLRRAVSVDLQPKLDVVSRGVVTYIGQRLTNLLRSLLDECAQAAHWGAP